jgi:undecaprenyl-diphosphatase
VQTTWQAAILGAVQGLTEFLPISSSAHLRLMPWLFGWETPASAAHKQAFDVSLHIGTTAAVVLYFFFDWLLIAATYVGDLRQRKWLGSRRGSLLPKIAVACIPAALVGFTFEQRIEDFFYSHSGHIWVLAVTLAVFGLLLLVSERIGKQTLAVEDVTYLMALLIGTAQALALIPGTSRSGITILAALLIGLRRADAARFSFLMATPITVGAVLVKLDDLGGSEQISHILVGSATSFVVGLAAIMFLLKYVQTRTYALFVYYRWALAALVLAVYFMRQG